MRSPFWAEDSTLSRSFSRRIYPALDFRATEARLCRGKWQRGLRIICSADDNSGSLVRDCRHSPRIEQQQSMDRSLRLAIGGALLIRPVRDEIPGLAIVREACADQ